MTQVVSQLQIKEYKLQKNYIQIILKLISILLTFFPEKLSVFVKKKCFTQSKAKYF